MFSPFLGVSVCPSAVVAHKLSKLNESAQDTDNAEKGNDLDYIMRNYKHIYEAQQMTRRQAGFIKAPLDIYVSQYEHLVDNEATVDFAAKNRDISVYFLKSTHFFGKSEFAIEVLCRPFKALLQK